MTMLTSVARPVALESIEARAADFAARARWSPEQLDAHRRARLREVVSHAVEQSPYYRKMIGADALRSNLDLEQLPTLPKASAWGPSTRLAAIGAPSPTVLLTNLVNRAQPLIRYELTDSVTLAAPDLIASIDGRSDDILVLPGKEGGEVAVHPLRLRAPFAGLAQVALYSSSTTATSSASGSFRGRARGQTRRARASGRARGARRGGRHDAAARRNCRRDRARGPRSQAKAREENLTGVYAQRRL